MTELPTAADLRASDADPSRAADEKHHTVSDHWTLLGTARKRAARARALRVAVPRASHAVWAPQSDRQDPISLLEAQAETWVPELVPIRYGRMMASPFAFFRGAAAIMAADLAHTPLSGPRVQLCGDAHLANFGGFVTPERNLIFSINDFDETLPGPWEWDVKRLAASFEVVGRTRGFAVNVRRALVLAAVGEYRQAMREFATMGDIAILYSQLTAETIKERWGALVTDKPLLTFEEDVAKARARDSERAVEGLTHEVDGRLQIVSQPPLIVPIEDLMSETQRAAFETFVRGILHTYSESWDSHRRRLLEQYYYMHAARKVVGVGSAGTRCWIVLLQGRHSGDPLLLQIKEAQASVLEPYAGESQCSNHGQRVVEGQQLTQAVSDIFLGWFHGQGDDGLTRDFYVRQLWDWKIPANVETPAVQVLMMYARMCGRTLARAHAITGDRIEIGAYLGGGDAFDRALASFASAYADQNERDHRALVEAVKGGRVTAEAGM
jgi:hypothetical protein